MDLKYRVTLAAFFLLIASSPLFAAAKLRLETTAIPPVSVSVGSNGQTQTVNATDAGDKALNLSVASSVPWMAPTVGSLTNCTWIGKCTPISIALKTASLAKGSYTGFVTVSDPNAIDAPQNISVTVAIGGGVPDSMTMWVPAGGAKVSQTFFTGGVAKATPTAPAGGPSLTVTPPSLSLPGGGSFEGTYTFTVNAQAGAGVASSAYTGSVKVSGSPVSDENKTVGVTINVTSQPIASLSEDSLSFRIAQNALKQPQNIVVGNWGSGTLSITKADIKTATEWFVVNGAPGLTAATGSNYVTVTADPTGLSPGVYQGSVVITTNAANSPLTVPISLTILAPSAPVTFAGGVTHNATFTNDPLALGDFPAVFGEQFTTGAPVIQTNVPYPNSAGGATVYVNDQPVPLYFVSANQINFLLPFDTPTGDATLRVDRDGQRGNTVSISIVPRAAKLLLATNQAYQLVAYALSDPLLAVKPGDWVTVYGFGFGKTSPSVTVNHASPSDSLIYATGTNTAYFGTAGLGKNPVAVAPYFIGLAPGFVTSFYQINVQIPANAPKGAAVPMYIQGDAGSTNELLLNIQ